MTRRTVLATMAAAAVTATVGAGLAAGQVHHSAGRHAVAMPPFCVVASPNKSGPYDGLCVWVPGLP